MDTLSWYKTWPLNGYNPTHVKKNSLRKHKELAEVLGADQETKSQLHGQFLGIWQSL